MFCGIFILPMFQQSRWKSSSRKSLLCLCWIPPFSGPPKCHILLVTYDYTFYLCVYIICNIIIYIICKYIYIHILILLYLCVIYIVCVCVILILWWLQRRIPVPQKRLCRTSRPWDSASRASWPPGGGGFIKRRQWREGPSETGPSLLTSGWWLLWWLYDSYMPNFHGYYDG